MRAAAERAEEEFWVAELQLAVAQVEAPVADRPAALGGLRIAERQRLGSDQKSSLAYSISDCESFCIQRRSGRACRSLGKRE